MAKRCVDVTVCAAGLVLLAPLLAAIAVAIRVASRGPAIYRSRRAGRGGAPFAMHKFRTMHVDQGPMPGRLTQPDDPRVFSLGALLRRTKLDELPELYDVLRGEMSIVGPRPEDPYFVEHHYNERDMITLSVRPGLTSPASLYDYARGDELLSGADVERLYLQRLLPARLAMEALYVREASGWYDLRIVGRTLAAMLRAALGQPLPDPPELGRALAMLDGQS